LQIAPDERITQKSVFELPQKATEQLPRSSDSITGEAKPRSKKSPQPRRKVSSTYFAVLKVPISLAWAVWSGNPRSIVGI